MITRRSLGASALGLLASQTLLADLFAAGAAASTLPLGLDRFSSTLSADGKTRMLCGLEIDLDQSSVPQTTNIIVEADIVRINGAIRMPGQSFAIVARRIECRPGAQIDTSGATGSPDYMIPAADGPDFGKNGADGSTGGTGQSGGDVTIVAQTIAAPLVVVANGGKGGNAESGGAGAAGQPGRNWQMGWGKGEDGKVGGQGGLAGAPGAGGKAGAISVLTFDDSHAKVVATAHGGPPGAQGKNGLPGASGAGGNGGQHNVMTKVCGDR